MYYLLLDLILMNLPTEGNTNGGGSGLKEIDNNVQEGDLNATNKQ